LQYRAHLNEFLLVTFFPGVLDPARSRWSDTYPCTVSPPGAISYNSHGQSSSLYVYDQFPVPNFQKSGDLDFAIHRGVYPLTSEMKAGSDEGLIQSYQGTELKT
jgi:hypothetical protein